MQKIVALIPVYNEEASIGPLLKNFDLAKLIQKEIETIQSLK